MYICTPITCTHIAHKNIIYTYISVFMDLNLQNICFKSPEIAFRTPSSFKYIIYIFYMFILTLRYLPQVIAECCIRWSGCTTRVFRLCGAWKCAVTRLKSVALLPFLYHFYKHSTTLQWSLIGVALMQHGKRYTSRPVGTMHSSCTREYVQVKLTSVI